MGVSDITIKVLKLTCERCGNSWISRATKEKLPKKCPKCLSFQWNIPIKYPKMSQARLKILQEKRETKNN